MFLDIFVFKFTDNFFKRAGVTSMFMWKRLFTPSSLQIGINTIPISSDWILLKKSNNRNVDDLYSFYKKDLSANFSLDTGHLESEFQVSNKNIGKQFDVVTTFSNNYGEDTDYFIIYKPKNKENFPYLYWGRMYLKSDGVIAVYMGKDYAEFIEMAKEIEKRKK